MDLIKTTPDERDCPPVSADYLHRHRIGIAKLTEYVVLANIKAANPGLTWPEMAEVVEDVAYHWNSVDGQLANFEHFRKACERRAMRALGKRKTDRITVTVKDAVSIVTAEGEIGHKVIGNAHAFSGYSLPDPDDQYRGPNGAA
jgi:hypothetical protein